MIRFQFYSTTILRARGFGNNFAMEDQPQPNSGRGRGRGRGRGQDQNELLNTHISQPLRARGRPNRQPRQQQNSSPAPGSQSQSDSFRGGRGRGRGQRNHFGRGNFPSFSHSGGGGGGGARGADRVPASSSLAPGVPVAIILKADQPTGHRVHGIVAETLTRGDHPRGVKVRLRDGRVGRVQALVSQGEGEAGEAAVGGAGAGLGRNGEGSRQGAFRGGRIERDVRENDEYFYDEERSRREGQNHPEWFAALEEADRRHAQGNGGFGGAEASREDREESTAVCPVCGEFEGDERAVAFHVESHFAE